MRAIAICSGGLDSTTMLYDMINSGYDVTVLSFDYGQRHKIELDYVERTAKKLNLRWILERMPSFKSALTEPMVDIPKASYDDQSQKITVVPNRNMIMIAIAGGYAVSEHCQEVWYAAHAGDHTIYPDCREEFVDPLTEALREGTYERIQLVAPYLNIDKSDIVERGSKLGVPFEETWSCYDPQQVIMNVTNDYVNRTQTAYVHCGHCGTCEERKEAFRLAGVRDPTIYMENWLTTTTTTTSSTTSGAHQ